MVICLLRVTNWHVTKILMALLEMMIHEMVTEMGLDIAYGETYGLIEIIFLTKSDVN